MIQEDKQSDKSEFGKIIMRSLITPFGEIEIKIDGKAIPYVALEGKKIESLCPDILGRYQIEIHFKPDGKKHEISCTFTPNNDINRTPESGEDIECQGFYNSKRYKMSIGLLCESGSIGGVRFSDKYDYDADYLENGMSYIILEETKTESYTFGIAWIDNVGWDDPIDDERDRDVETWYASDPSLSL